jgi:hypothetical protein
MAALFYAIGVAAVVALMTLGVMKFIEIITKQGK